MKRASEKKVLIFGGFAISYYLCHIIQNICFFLYFIGKFDARICIETNGTQPVPGWVEWITVSPKNELPLQDVVPVPSELKFVFEPEHIPYYLSMQDADCEKRIQPLARRDGTTNLREALEFVLAHPRFKLSVQLHKLIGVR